MIIALILTVVGIALVVKGADFLVDGASSVAKRFRIQEIVIGLTVVAFGTSAPELVVNVIASVVHKNDIVLGNIIGSNIFNTLFILGVAGLICPLEVIQNTVRKEIPFAFIAGALLLLMTNDRIFSPASVNVLSRIDGLILLGLFGYFMYYTFVLSKTKATGSNQIKILSPLRTWAYLLLGFAGLFFGGKLVVDNAVVIARILGVSEKLIALTIVSAGTSLPELATSAVAAYKKRFDLAVGNVVGSNIFNILFILGISAEISPVQYNTAFNFDLIVYLIATLMLFIAMFTFKVHKLDRREAAVFLLGYIAYLVYIISLK